MNTLQHTPAESRQSEVDLVVAFLEDRLEERETIEWALQLGLDDDHKRRAILRLLNVPWGNSLREPWCTAWRLIEESWKGETDHRNRMPLAQIKQRLKSGDRSEGLISAIVKLVEPKLAVESYEIWQREFYNIPERPKTSRHLFHVKLTSGSLIDPASLDLQEITDRHFIDSLARALDAAVMHGLNIASQNKLVPPHLFLRRVHYVCKSDRGDVKHEPDEFRTRIAPSVKLLFAVVSRLVDLDPSSALVYVHRWKHEDSPIHTRLWATISYDSGVSPPAEVADFLLNLDDRPFWEIGHFPEIGELRATRFCEIDNAGQQAILGRIRRKPPRDIWPRNAKSANVARARLYWAIREFRRIEVAGGTLIRPVKSWMDLNISRFPELEEMDRVDEGFSNFIRTREIPATPDPSLDSLDGDDRLRELERRLSTQQGWATIKEQWDPLRILADIEKTPDGGSEFPRCWEFVGWVHSLPEVKEDVDIERDAGTETRRVLRLLEVLSAETVSESIAGITHWLNRWERFVVAEPNWSAVWLRVWPFSIEATNRMHESSVVPDLNVVAQTDVDESDDLDVLNPPSGKLVSVFLEALNGVGRPFDGPGELQRVRDQVIGATGHSGLIARYLMIEALGYFLHADREWAMEYLVEPLRENDDRALQLWRALSRRTQTTDVLLEIGEYLISRTMDDRLDRTTRGSLAFSAVIESLYALRENRDPTVEQESVQQMIRLLDDEVRAECARAITRYVSEVAEPSAENPITPSAERLYRCSARPFLRHVWPKERSLASPGVSGEFARLPAIARGEFAEAVDTIERFLVPFDCWSMFDYGFEKDGRMAASVIVDDIDKAKALLRLLDRTIGTAEEAIVPHDLGDALEQVRNVATKLALTPEYRRLETLASRA